jgi:hypothetical protein
MATRAQLKTVGEIVEELPKPEGLALLRVEFPPHQISKLPKPYKKDSPKGKCNECGGYHGLPAVHLDYVGHAALTDRLLDADPLWSWEPVGVTPEGLPALDRNGGLWIKLTVCGVTRYGYGAADGKSGGDAMKEMIGDALRNAAMRFGAALDLWHKGDLHVDDEPISTGEDKPKPRQKLPDIKEGVPAPYPFLTHLQTATHEFVRTLNSFADLEEFTDWGKTDEVQLYLKQLRRDLPGWWGGGNGAPDDWVPIEILIAQRKRDLEQIAGLKEPA